MFTEPEVQAPATEETAVSDDKKDDSAHEAPYGSVRSMASDHGDAHVSWTSQSGDAFPLGEQGRTTKFHRDELPDPEVIAQAGLSPIVYSPLLLDDEHVTQPPTANPPLDDPIRIKNREKTLEAGRHPNPQLEQTIAKAKAQKEGRDPNEVDTAPAE